MSDETTKRKRGGAHPPHPKCPECGKAMYKAMYGRAVKKEDAWAFCRNPSCSLCGKDQSGTAPEEYQASGEKEWRKSRAEIKKKREEAAKAKGKKKSKEKTPAKEKKPGKKKSKEKTPAKEAPAKKKTVKKKTANGKKKPAAKPEEKSQLALIADDLMEGKLSIKKIAAKHHCGAKKVRAVRNKLQDRGDL